MIRALEGKLRDATQPVYDRLDYAALPVRGDGRVKAMGRGVLRAVRGYGEFMDPLSLKGIGIDFTTKERINFELDRAADAWDMIPAYKKAGIGILGLLGAVHGIDTVFNKTEIDEYMFAGLNVAGSFIDERVTPYVGELLFSGETDSSTPAPSQDITDYQRIDPNDLQRINAPFFDPNQATS